MKINKNEEIKKKIRERYAGAVASGSRCCDLSCCANCDSNLIEEKGSLKTGYSPEELAKIPAESNLGLGCGNPTALADLNEGEIVLDLGAGAGVDCFLASSKVGPSGRVIGVDMTPEMVERARENARLYGYSNVEFRWGEIENLPAADNSVDVVISNCVINLSLDKARVFREAFRVLKPGGRLLVSDLVLSRPLSQAIRENIDLYTACIAGAVLKDDYLRQIELAGFRYVEVVHESALPAGSGMDAAKLSPLAREVKVSPEELVDVLGSVISLSVKAVKGK